MTHFGIGPPWHPALDTVSAFAASNPASKSKPTASTAHRQGEEWRAKKFLIAVIASRCSRRVRAIAFSRGERVKRSRQRPRSGADKILLERGRKYCLRGHVWLGCPGDTPMVRTLSPVRATLKRIIGGKRFSVVYTHNVLR